MSQNSIVFLGSDGNPVGSRGRGEDQWLWFFPPYFCELFFTILDKTWEQSYIFCIVLWCIGGWREQRAGGGVPCPAAQAGHLCDRLPGAEGAARGLVPRHAGLQDERGVRGQLAHAQPRREETLSFLWTSRYPLSTLVIKLYARL